jgi:hypothetical protein
MGVLRTDGWFWKLATNAIVLCACGCGGLSPLGKLTNRRLGLKRGTPLRFIQGHNKRSLNYGRVVHSGGYVKVLCHGHPRATRSGYVWEHILVAEKALGGFLPPGAEVHHVDTNRANNGNDNLVICPDHAYHALLHARMLARSICGNPNFRPCTTCSMYDDPLDMRRSTRTSGRIDYYHAQESRNWSRCSPISTIKQRERRNRNKVTA